MENTEQLNYQTIKTLKDIGQRCGKEDYFDGILSMFVKQSDLLIEELSIAIVTKQIDSVLHLAHKLKGSSQCVGAKTLEDLCQKLQEWAEQGDGDFSLAQNLFDQIEDSYSNSKSLLKQHL